MRNLLPQLTAVNISVLISFSKFWNNSNNCYPSEKALDPEEVEKDNNFVEEFIEQQIVTIL